MVKVMLGIISVTLIWGYTWVAMKVGIHDIPPLLFSGLRLFIGAVPLFLILFIQRKKLTIQKEHLKSYIIMSLLMGLGYMGIQNWSHSAGILLSSVISSALLVRCDSPANRFRSKCVICEKPIRSPPFFKIIDKET